MVQSLLSQVIRWTYTHRFASLSVILPSLVLGSVGATKLLLRHWLSSVVCRCILPFLATRYLQHFRKLAGAPVIVRGSSQISEGASRLPSLQWGPRPPIWAAHSSLQFIPWMLQNSLHQFFPLLGEVHELQVADFQNKEDPRSPKTMVDNIRVHVFSRRGNVPLDEPLIVILPGLCCDAQDLPGQHTLRYALSRGYRCAVIERRGQGKKLRMARFNIFGDSDDLEDAYRRLRELFAGAPFFLAGISAGSALVVSALGKFDARRRAGDNTAPQFVAAGDLYPGFDIAPKGCMVQLQPVYATMLLGSMKTYFLERNSDVLRAFDEGAFQAAAKAGDCDEFLDAVSVFAGYPSGREAFDAGENPVRFMDSIDTPLLVLLTADDPISVLSNFTDVTRGSLHDAMNDKFRWNPDHRVTYRERVLCSLNTVVCIAKSGSHCPTLDGYIWPFRFSTRSMACWSDEALLDYFDYVRTKEDLEEPK